jgi:hypothetical protein
MKIFYKAHNFRGDSSEVIAHVNRIVEQYQAQGYNLTLRQIYYQFVAHNFFSDSRRYRPLGGNRWAKDASGTKNCMPNYTMLSKVVSNARLAGLIDWDAIVDRTRRLNSLSHFDGPIDVLRAAKYSYHIDMWERQDYTIQVWIEKDALTGVIAGVCNKWDIPYIAVRGYNSQSTMHEMATLLKDAAENGKMATVLHLGDHDPSGIDMTRDNYDRLDLFLGYNNIDVRRLALNYNQVEQYNPPPNPAKMSDSRASGYVLEYGYDSWELDALEPKVISDLIEDEILGMVYQDIWDEDVKREKEGKEQIEKYIQMEGAK